MSRIEKTVFISYRRSTGSAWALAVWQNLTHHDYDVFFDYQGIASGDFEQVILENITARAHFLVLLTPSALEGVEEPGDWLRREIEAALEHRRNIVPLLLEGFDFATTSLGRHLTGTLAPLKSYNGLTVPVEYFDEAMNRLRTRHLNVAVDAVLHPRSDITSQATSRQRVAVQAAPAVQTGQLAAVQWFERGVEATDMETKISYYTEAIRLRPDYADAYYNRGNALIYKPDFDGAEADYTAVIQLTPDRALAYNNRGLARSEKGDLDGALADYTEAIRLKPFCAEFYANRALIRKRQSDLKAAIADYQMYLDEGGGVRNDNQADVEDKIRQLRKELDI